MANPHPLDAAYDSWIDSAIVPPPNDGLLAEVLIHCRRLCRDEDAAQDAVIYIMDHLERFVRRDASSFSRWVMSVSRRRRLEAVRRVIASRSEIEYAEETLPQMDDDHYSDWTKLPDDLRAIAESLINGSTIQEIAGDLGVKPKSIWKKVQGYLSPKVTISA
ncbi:MAG: sigma-70 family RNA polymerase sigma factor [Acidobacteria bacterium]|nr:sigma-70 family RNA polymerase sigma factor [Acidobacteriota bacterium]